MKKTVGMRVSVKKRNKVHEDGVIRAIYTCEQSLKNAMHPTHPLLNRYLICLQNGLPLYAVDFYNDKGCGVFPSHQILEN